MLGGRTVIILGAGASVGSDHHLPSMAGFFVEGGPLHPDLRRFLEWFYPNRAYSEFNLEEVLAYLDLARNRSGAWGYRPAKTVAPSELYRHTIDLVRERLYVATDKPCSVHTRLFRALDRRDSILTLNYDLVADTALMELEGPNPDSSRAAKLGNLLADYRFKGETPPTLTSSEEEMGFYLKLHGSLDWLHCPNRGCPNNGRYFASSLARFRGGQLRGKPCRMCGAPVEVFLVPPVASKRLDDYGRMAFLWHIALREIATAHNVVVVGISMAASDFELRWLIRQGIELNLSLVSVTVVNPSQEHTQNMVRLLPANALLHKCFTSIDDFLASSAA